jgi:RadC-like JAB domain-containing protein
MSSRRRATVAYEPRGRNPAGEDKGVFRWTSVAFNSRADAIKFQGLLEKIHSTIVAELSGHIVTTNATARDIDRVLRKHTWEKPNGWQIAPNVQAAESGAACPPREHACSCGHKHVPGNVDVDGRAVAGPTVASECPPGMPRHNVDEIAIANCDVVIRRRSEARDSGPAIDHSAMNCGPFTRVVRDESKFSACMALARQVGPIDDDRKLYAILGPDLTRQDQEIFVVVGLDINNALRVYAEVARGQRDRVAVAVDDVMRPVLLEGCTALAVAHNHPSGNPSPSEKDAELTEKIRAGCRSSGVVFLDHLVVGQDAYYSFADRRLKRL